MDYALGGLRRCSLQIEAVSLLFGKQSIEILQNILTHIARSTSGPGGRLPQEERLQLIRSPGSLAIPPDLVGNTNQNGLSAVGPFRHLPGSQFSEISPHSRPLNGLVFSFGSLGIRLKSDSLPLS